MRGVRCLQGLVGLYALKNMPSLDEVPDSEVFLQRFRTAEIAQFSEKEYQAYLDSLKVLRDNANTFDYAVSDPLA